MVGIGGAHLLSLLEAGCQNVQVKPDISKYPHQQLALTHNFHFHTESDQTAMSWVRLPHGEERVCSNSHHFPCQARQEFLGLLIGLVAD